MAAANETRVVVVTGDVTFDWNVARIPAPSEPDAPGRRGTTRVSFEAGGAALLGRLVRAIAEDTQKRDGRAFDVRTVAEPRLPPFPGDGRSDHSIAIWSLVDRDAGVRDGPKVWRISQQVGIDAAGPEAVASLPLVDEPSTADLVVIDAGRGFGQDRGGWPRAITATEAEPWIVLMMARPTAVGLLWDDLRTRHASRLVAVVRANDLRVTDAQISRELSWERTAEDLIWELTYNPELKELSRCAHLVVSFGTSGALLVSGPEAGPRQARLFFDPPVMEEEWAEKHPGGMIGSAICLASALAREIMLTSDAPRLDRAVQRGLDAMRNLHRDGYEADAPDSARLRFPAERIADVLAQDRASFADVLIPQRARPTETGDEARSWTILEEVFTEGLEPLARRIVLHGPGDVVAKVPVARFGKLLTVDRQEIEGYRSIRSLIGQYARQTRPERPLSIAVFGRPGSGKSFGIKQIALSMLPGLIEPLTFNLSQFHAPDQLLDAFHQVRDESLKGKLPLVFWDEFDAKLEENELGWLKHFLAPMQDGEFQQGQVTHHIGPAIFVFAGGTKQRMDDFSAQTSEAFTTGKGRDFVSRLKGYVDVLGPNPVGDAASDPHYIIRRAILLRSMLESRKDLIVTSEGKKELRIDAGVVRAFLRVNEYVHGARSMESVIAMSLLDGRSRFERSSLPSEEQLAIHVDAQDFLRIVRSLVVEGRMSGELAAAAHVAYCANMLADGFTWNEPGDDYLEAHELLRPFVGRARDAGRTAPNLVAYESLPADVKEQNEDFARDIPNKIESIGYEIRRSQTGEAGDAFPEEVIELLAEQEHDRWTRLKLRQLWSWGPQLDRTRLLHSAMLPWRAMTEDEQIVRYGPDGAPRIGTAVLPDNEKDKDRAMIRAVTTILAKNGYIARKA